jgi:hypothetical protein
MKGAASKKAALREKLKSNFEWTDEAINDFSVNGVNNLAVTESKSPQADSDESGLPSFMVKNGPKKDTMEEKIERVQIRKREADERANKKGKTEKNVRKISDSSMNNLLKDFQDGLKGNTIIIIITTVITHCNHHYSYLYYCHQ